MTIIQKAILAEIKAHILKDIETDSTYADFERFLHGMKLESMTYDHKRGAQTMCSPQFGDISLSIYTVKTRFKAKKYENNIAIWQVNMYSDGKVGIYFDGTEYAG